MNRGHLVGIGAAALLLIGSAGVAEARSHTCNKLPANEIEIDGMMDDWDRIGWLRVGGSNANRSFDLRCGYDKTTLYVSLNIRDQKVVRRGRNSDSARIGISAAGTNRSMVIVSMPGVGKIKPSRSLNRRKLPKWVDIEDSLQPRGWSVEIGIPLRKIPGWSAATPSLDATISVGDSDGGRVKSLSFRGRLFFPGGAAVFKNFLKSARLSKADIKFDRMVDVDGIRGKERVVVGGTVLGVITNKYAFINLPVRSVRDVLGVKVIDLAGAGRYFFLAHYRQHGNGGSREVVGVWTYRAGSFNRILGVEVKKTMGGNELSCRWYLAPKGKYRKGKRSKRGRDLVVEAIKAKGWDEDSYEEVPAKDVKPILLPWEDQTTAVYWFQGSRAGGGAAKRGR